MTALHEQRVDAVVEAVRRCRAEPILDVGCGDGPSPARRKVELRHHSFLEGVDRHAGFDMALSRREH